jgi:serralysin
VAAIVVNSGYGFDVRDLDFSSLYNGYYYTHTPILYQVDYGNGWKDQFRGVGFTYNPYLEPTGGTVTSYAAYYSGARLFSVDGISVAATSIAAAAKTYSLSDDRVIISIALAGSDTFSGGGQADYFNGYAGNDTLRGNGGNDTLIGNAGNDTLFGGAGHDRLSGGTGKDTFVFNSPLVSANSDTITDFSHIDDTIKLENSFFKGMGSGALLSKYYYAGTKAHDGNDHIIYNKATGALYYDSDGTGPNAQVQFATIANHSTAGLTYSDFVLI